MSIRDELLAIQQSDPERILRCETVVGWAAKHPGSDIYESLDWDDPHAANAYRLGQVRRLIQLHIITEEGAPMMVSLLIDRREDGGGYRSIEDVLPMPSLRDMMLREALAELERIQKKYQTLTELAAVFTEAEAARRANEERASRQRRNPRRRAA